MLKIQAKHIQPRNDRSIKNRMDGELKHRRDGSQSLPMPHFTKIMATFGILASSLGGNLEEEHDLKAVLIYEEET